MHIVGKLIERGTALTTTEHHVDEFYRVLTQKFSVPDPAAQSEVHDVLTSFSVLASADYADYRDAAERRLTDGGKSDWPALAAALSQQGSIWSDDRDFFGVGVPVWSTPNVHFAPVANDGANKEK